MILSGNTRRFYLISLLVLATGWLWLIAGSFASIDNFTPCIFKNITGYPCPSCGATSAAKSILALHFSDAFFHNPLGFLIVPALLLLPFWIILDILRNKASLSNAYTHIELALKQRPLLLCFIILLIAANWIWNLYK